MKRFVLPYLLLTACTVSADRKIVCFGDSVTEGYGVSASAAWCSKLSTLPNTKTINLGVGGNSSRDGLARFDDALAQKPDWITIMFGLGDAYDPDEDGIPRISLEEYERNIRAMIKKAKRKNIKVLLMSSNATTDTKYNARLKPYILTIRKIAADCDVSLVENYSAFAEAIIEGVSYFVDYAHPNELGQQKIFEGAVKFFKKQGRKRNAS